MGEGEEEKEEGGRGEGRDGAGTYTHIHTHTQHTHTHTHRSSTGVKHFEVLIREKGVQLGHKCFPSVLEGQPSIQYDKSTT